MKPVLFVIVSLMVLRPAHAFADETITSDTLDYCDALADRMQQRPMPASVRRLLLEGRAMCERGDVINGLRRIRLAMMVVHHQQAVAP